jgi:hypothetical protein
MMDFDEEDLDTKAAVKLTMWVNSSSETVAIKIKIPSADAEIFVGTAVDGKETGYEFYMKDSTMKVFAVTAKTTEAKGKISGKVNIEASGKEFVELEIKDFDVEAFEENGYVNGTFILEPGKEYKNDEGKSVIPYNAKKVFDISQTNAKPRNQRRGVSNEEMILKALIKTSTVDVVIRNDNIRSFAPTNIRAGSVIKHDVFGEGIVINEHDGLIDVVFKDPKFNRKTLNASHKFVHLIK